MKIITDYLLARLKERSTWQGLILLATALGVGISPEHAEAIATTGATIVGGIWTLTHDK
jgi:hypothetical protein